MTVRHLVIRGIDDADYSTDYDRAGDIQDAHYESVSYPLWTFHYKKHNNLFQSNKRYR